MKKTIRRLLLLAFIVAVIVAVAVAVNAEELPIVEGGYAYDNAENMNGEKNDIKWTFNPNTGTLTFDGTSDSLIDNYTGDSETNDPWKAYIEDVKHIVLGASITKISGYGYFKDHVNLETFTFKSGTLSNFQNGSTTLQNLFTNCPKLTKIGPEGTADNTYDLRNFYWTVGNSDDSFEGCGGGQEITVLMPYSGYTVFGRTSKNLVYKQNDFSGATKVTFKTTIGSKADEQAALYIENNPSKFEIVEYDLNELITNGEVTILESGTSSSKRAQNPNGYSLYNWTVYSNGEMVFECTNADPTNTATYKPIRTFSVTAYNSGDETIDTIKNKTVTLSDGTTPKLVNFVTKITFIDFTEYHARGTNAPLDGWSKLVAIDMGTITDIYYRNVKGGMRNNPKLTTVGSTVAGCYNRDVVDLSFLTKYSMDFDAHSLFGQWYVNSSDQRKDTQTFFYGDASIKKIILPNFETAWVDGVTVTGYRSNETFEYAFNGCTALEEVVFPNTLRTVTLDATTFNGCTSLTKVVFDSGDDVVFSEDFVLPSTVTEVVCYSEIVKTKLEAAGVTATVTVEEVPAHLFVTGEGSSSKNEYKVFFDYSFNPFNGELVITATASWYDSGKTWAEDSSTVLKDKTYYFLNSATLSQTFKDFKTDYDSHVTSIKLVGFTELQADYKNSAVAGWSELVSIDLGNIYYCNTFGAAATSDFCLFGYNPKLTTVGSSVDGTLVDGVVDLSCITYMRHSDHFARAFIDCTSITKVIMPAYTKTSAANVVPNIFATTFSGCTALEEVVIPNVGYTITDGAFDGLTALTKIDLRYTEFTDDAENKLLPDLAGLSVFCNSKETYDSFTGYTNTQFVYLGKVITSEGFGVRPNQVGTEVNGLRSYYAVNLTELYGLTLKEYGAILVSKNKLGNQTLALNWNGSEYVVNVTGAQKIKADKLISDTADQKVFAATLVNIAQDKYDADIYACGYAVLTDDTDEYIVYTNYGENNAEWTYMNLYKATQYAANTGAFDGKRVDENTVWNVLAIKASTAETAINGNTYFMIVDGVLYVRNIDGTKPATTEAETYASNNSLTYTSVVAFSVKNDPNVETPNSTYTAVKNALDASGLTEEEKKKSFIFVTDTHWSTAEGNETNKQLTTAVSYASQILGGAMVVHGGDLYGGFPNATTDNDDAGAQAYALATGIVGSYFDTQLEANFKGNYLYALGNHCTNIIGYKNAYKAAGLTDSSPVSELLPYMYSYLISDKDMYALTVGKIDAGMKAAGKEIVYDTASIELIERLLIAARDSEDPFYLRKQGGDNPDTTTLEITDDIIVQAKSLMKMHYHYDDTDAKVRYIVMDSGGGGFTQQLIFNGGASTFLMYQNKWLAETLKSTPAGYDVVVTGHQISVISDTTLNSVVLREFYNILNAFKSGGTVTTTNNGYYHWNSVTKGMLEGTKLTNYSFDSAFSGNIITIGGHNHADYGYYVDTDSVTSVQFGSNDAVTGGTILSITTGTPVNNQEQPDNDGVNLTDEFPNNMRFDIVTLMDDGSIKITRIGAGQSREWTYDKVE